MAQSATRSIKPQQRSSLYWSIHDSLILIKRSVMHIIKSPDQLASVAFQPIMFLVLFRYVFGGAIATGGTSYVNFLVAGIIIQSAAFGSSYTAFGVATDLQRGIIDRFRSLPMISSAVLIGHTVSDLLRNFISTLIMIAVGYVVGFRPEASPIEWMYAFAIILLFTFAISWIMAILGLLVKTIEAVQWISFVAIFPLTFASSAFAPTESMPKYLRIFAQNQPVSQVIDAVRALLVGDPIGNKGWIAAAYCIGTLLITIPLASYIFRRMSR